MNKRILNTLITLANKFDQHKLYDEASMLDELIKKICLMDNKKVVLSQFYGGNLRKFLIDVNNQPLINSVKAYSVDNNTVDVTYIMSNINDANKFEFEHFPAEYFSIFDKKIGNVGIHISNGGRNNSPIVKMELEVELDELLDPQENVINLWNYIKDIYNK